MHLISPTEVRPLVNISASAYYDCPLIFRKANPAVIGLLEELRLDVGII
jgi:hypothetical protein